MENKRLISIDFLRGLAIVILVIIHRIHYNWTGMQSSETVREYMSGPLLPILIFIILLLSMAGLFYFITGIVNAFSINSRIESGKDTWHRTIMYGLLGGIWLIILNYIQRLFFMNGFLVGENGGVPEYQIGYITGLIRDASQVRFYWQQVTEPGTLSLIGILLILISLVTSLLLAFKKRLNLTQMQIIIVIMAIVSMLSSIFIKLYLIPIYDKFLANGEFFKAALCGHICKDFSLSPYFGYALIGAAMGLSLAFKENKKLFKRKSIVISVVLMLTGVIIYLFFDKEKFGGRGTMGVMVTLIELGLFIFLFLILLSKFDYCNEEKKEIRRIKSKWIRRFGMMSLTVYILEPVLAEILKKGIDYFISNTWNNHFVLVLFYALLCLLLWHFILKIWQKARFIWSFEWLTGWMLLKLLGKKSGKVNFKEL